MHRSRVYALRIDSPEDPGGRHCGFLVRRDGPPSRWRTPRFTLLHQALPGLVTAVQAVGDAPRFHLDIETDDVAAETARLLALGAVPASP